MITVQDLFYNIPSRRRALDSGGRRSERDEYDRILNVVQRYAVHEAKRGVGFLCRGGGGTAGGGKGKKGFGGGFGGGSGNHTDLNTQSLGTVKRIQERRKRGQQQQQQPTTEEQFAATKDVIGHIFGTAVTRELLPLTASEGDVEAVSLAALKAMVQKKENSGSSLALDANDEINEGSQKEETEQTAEESNGTRSEFTNSLLEEMMMGGAEDDSVPAKEEEMDNTKQTTTTAQTSKFAFAYRATGLITNGSYSAPKSSSAFLLFINDRLVESSSIRRAVDNVYSDTLPKGGKPFIYLALELPGPHVDVNVHPTKREVAFLHEDRLCDAISKVVRGVIGGATSSRTFSVANGGRLLPREEKDERSSRSDLLRNSKKVATMDDLASSSLEKNDAMESRIEEAGKENTVNTESGEKEASSTNADIKDDVPNEPDSMKEQKSETKTPKKRSAAAANASNTKSNPSAKRAYDPSRLVRTNRTLPVGALEPFLVQKEAKGSSSEKAGQSSNEANVADSTGVKHKPGCPIAGQQVDMTKPGAFALAMCRCQVERSESLPQPPAPNNGIVVRNNTNVTVPRQKKITPTDCEYESISNLRDEITNLNHHQGLNETLRGSTYVGAISRSRSLIQCGIDLLMINHQELARETFYQIALLKFGGMSMATLGQNGIDVMAVISQMLQFEEDLNSSNKDSLDGSTRVKVNKTNINLARQATTCLAEKAPMLEEYFSIKLEKVQVYNREKRQITSLRVTGLPILLDGHSPQPHGLPLFLLRLATEVNWSEEKPCFKGICTELASFYSELPYTSNAKDTSDDDAVDDDTSKSNSDFIDDEAKQYIKHTLFPAISYLLVPPKRFAGNSGAVIKLANLNSLYKVFERC